FILIDRTVDDAVARCVENRLLTAGIEQGDRRASQKIPAARGFERVHARLPAADADRSGRNAYTRRLQAWFMQFFIQSTEIRKARHETEHIYEVFLVCMHVDDFLFRQP